MSVDPFTGTRYRALSRLASGQRGEFYVVEHRELGKRFAAKVLRRELLDDPRVVDRMRLEAQSLGRLRHPNIVNIVGFEQTRTASPFLIMELLKGHSLETELSQRGALPLPEAIEWTEQLLSALEAAHGIGIIHRDLRPKHVFLHEPASGKRRLKLLDFGTVRIASGVSAQAPRPLDFPTEAGAYVLDAEFLCPELARGEAADIRSDLYQVGMLLEFMLTGVVLPAKSPPNGPGALAASTLPEAILGLLRRATATLPEDRFQTARAFRLALGRVDPDDLAGLPARGLPGPGRSDLERPISVAHSPATQLSVTHLVLFLTLAVGAAVVVLLLGYRLRGVP